MIDERSEFWPGMSDLGPVYFRLAQIGHIRGRFQDEIMLVHFGSPEQKCIEI